MKEGRVMISKNITACEGLQQGISALRFGLLTVPNRIAGDSFYTVTNSSFPGITTTRSPALSAIASLTFTPGSI